MWIKRLVEELKVFTPSSIKVYYGNKATIAITHNLVLHDITKHIEVDKHFNKEHIDNGVICMSCIQTINQVVDSLTKELYKKQFDNLVSKPTM